MAGRNISYTQIGIFSGISWKQCISLKEERIKLKSILINQDFRRMWGSEFLSILNGRFKELLIPLVVLGQTSSPLVTALVALSQQLGTVLFAIPIGTWVETKNKVRIASSCHFYME